MCRTAFANCTAMLALLLGGTVAPAAAGDKLAEKIEEFLAQPHYKTAHWGLLFVDLASGETIFAHEQPTSSSHRLRRRSCFRRRRALDALGADYRFRTPVYYRGTLADGVLEGDLILVASGDPCARRPNERQGARSPFRTRTTPMPTGCPIRRSRRRTRWRAFNDLARQIAATGIKRVRGDVLIDDRLFEHSEGSGSGPEPPHADHGERQRARLHVRADRARPAGQGDLASADGPVPGRGQRRNRGARTCRWRRGSSRRRTASCVVTGKIPAEQGQAGADLTRCPIRRRLPGPLLIEALRKAGVEVIAELPAKHPADAAARKPDGYSNAAQGRRAGLAAVCRERPADSEGQPQLARQHAAAPGGGEAAASGRWPTGCKLEREFLVRAGVDVDAISFGGGAGGSRADYVTPAATVQLLRHMATRPDFAVYERALPILGVDGTLAKACSADSPAKGKVLRQDGHAGVGQPAGRSGPALTSKALAGYMTTASGRKLAFAAFVNGVHMKDGIDTKRAWAAIWGRCARLCMASGSYWPETRQSTRCISTLCRPRKSLMTGL